MAERKKKKQHVRLLAGYLAALTLLGVHIPGISAYLTDMGNRMDNKFTVALDSTSTIVEKYPNTDPDISDGNIVSYEKAVQVINTGYIDEYVRVRLDFTESDIEEKTQFSWDGNNFYSVREYKNHLPSGWVYDASDGYYYYSPVVYTGDWESVRKTLRYDGDTGQYFYKEGQSIMEADMITRPLIRYVKTVFENPKDMRSYSLNVFSESCPFYFGNDYAGAWASYLAQ